MDAGLKQAVAMALAMLVCATGRALDFATTWVAVDKGTAVEAKPVAAHVFAWLGHHAGMITYEALITTPLIFLGCHVVRRMFRDEASSNAARLLFFMIGVISLTVALHNMRFIL